MAPEKPGMALPVMVVGSVDLNRLLREIKKVEAELQAQLLRSEGRVTQTLPRFSALLDEFVQLNKLDLLQSADQKRAVQFLEDVRQHSPKIHVSFNANPSPQFMSKLTFWFRNNIHPSILITVGLQPGIGAGCVIRTPNRYFDFSLSKSFENKRDLLVGFLQISESEVTA